MEEKENNVVVIYLLLHLIVEDILQKILKWLVLYLYMIGFNQFIDRINNNVIKILLYEFSKIKKIKYDKDYDYIVEIIDV